MKKHKSELEKKSKRKYEKNFSVNVEKISARPELYVLDGGRLQKKNLRILGEIVFSKIVFRRGRRTKKFWSQSVLLDPKTQKITKVI